MFRTPYRHASIPPHPEEPRRLVLGGVAPGDDGTLADDVGFDGVPLVGFLPIGQAVGIGVRRERTEPTWQAIKEWNRRRWCHPCRGGK